MADPLTEIRRICLALPEVNERQSHGAPCFFVRDKKAICYFHDNFHGDGRISLWASAPPGAQESAVAQEPDRFFVPPYVGHLGWLGVRLDVDVDWDEVEVILAEAYRRVAPKRLAAELDEAT